MNTFSLSFLSKKTYETFVDKIDILYFCNIEIEIDYQFKIQ